MNKDISKKESEYWGNFEKSAKKYGIPFWVDYQKANTREIPFINYSTDPQIDSLLLGRVKDFVISNSAKSKVLDLGCGAGWLSLELARKGSSVVGLDLSDERIKVARSYAKKQGIKIRYKVEDIGLGKWNKKNYYNVIVNWNSLHHVANTEDILKDINNSLVLEGNFVTWDHLGDNFLVEALSSVARLIPGYYEQKVKALGSIHSAAEGISQQRLTEKVVKKIFNIKYYQRYYIFVHLLPPIWKYLRYKLNLPIPKLLLILLVKFFTPLDNYLVKIFPSQASYCLFIASKKGSK